MTATGRTATPTGEPPTAAGGPATAAGRPPASAERPATASADSAARTGHALRTGLATPLVVAFAIALPLLIAYLIVSPASGDLAAATYRGDLVSRAGLLLWDDGWYAGHNLLGYSVLSPGLSALIGTRLQLVLSGLVACALFALLCQRLFAGTGATIAAGWFAFGFCFELASGRVAYDLGFAIGLGALLASVSRRPIAALALAVLTSLASPVAGAFLALVELANALGARSRPRARLSIGMCLAALLPILLLTAAFPEGGYEPFDAAAFWPELAGVMLVGALLALDRSHAARILGVGVGLYALALIASFATHTPMGGNTQRLGSLLAGPLLAGVLWRHHRTALALAAPVLLYWQLAASVHDLAASQGNPSVEAAYYAPLVSELHRLDGGSPTRIEVPLMDSHWEAVYLPRGEISLARGWERQLDTRYARLFYRPRLSAQSYRSWLLSNGVAYVALPDSALDSAGEQEAALIRSKPSFLRAVWRSRHWRLYAVQGATALAQPPARMLTLGIDSFALEAPRPGDYEVRLRFSPYWALTSGIGCVSESPGGFTELSVDRPGRVAVGIEFSLARLFNHGRRCSATGAMV